MSQSSLRNYTEGLLARPGNYAVVRRVKEAVQSIADDIGLPLDLFGARPGELDDDTAVVRYQYTTEFFFVASSGSQDDTDIGQVQFRTTLYTLTDPSDRVKDYLKGINHLRLHTLFNSGVYDGYMSGFNFFERSESEEVGHVVGRDEIPATGLGVPNFSTEVYDEDGDIAGYSRGYSMDFGVHKIEHTTAESPSGEVWKIRSFNEPRGDYEISSKPNTPARERAKNAAGKVAYINGIPAGSITSRGTIWFSKEHTNPAQATYRDRAYITEHTGTPYQALSVGAKLYKVNETPNGVYFSTVEPRDFDTISPEDVDPDATETVYEEAVMDLDEDEPTIFVVSEDVADPWALGKRPNSTTVEIQRETEFTMHTASRRGR